jgi:uncharacterized protein (DUF1697 family)
MGPPGGVGSTQATEVDVVDEGDIIETTDGFLVATLAAPTVGPTLRAGGPNAYQYAHTAPWCLSLRRERVPARGLDGMGRHEGLDMTRYALLLRGVNVGTKNRLPMIELRNMIEQVGCAKVKTYVQSGNAVFTTKLAEADVTKAIEHALEVYMGRPIATTLRTLEEMKAIVAGDPFGKVATNPAYLCVTFLSRAPSRTAILALQAQDWGTERFKLAGREIYTWHPHGQGRSPLAAALGKLPLRGAVTTRNWNTVLQLLELLGD